ncbi:PTS mannitol transporter subunit IIA [Izhakiella australiensis]|uniref:PTS mannitol transporter subunit IIA n=1 Tax=Izhakiella australiensis TaxID=1926881 RepID=A0A1S8YR42_9GAMM|nr:PTS sugar transporter subunit IIA [Izhakiella australiensis]OON41093.1 PTS mannitol transporter subunit IIA [Izhakiella australiensis]
MKEICSAASIVLNSKISERDEAIRAAGKLLVNGGYVSEKYIDLMLARERIASTYMGNHLAIPHGTDGAQSEIITSGISIIQLPDGVDFGGGELAYMVIGIAGKDGTHLDMLGQIAVACMEPDTVELMRRATSKQSIIDALGVAA